LRVGTEADFEHYCIDQLVSVKTDNLPPVQNPEYNWLATLLEGDEDSTLVRGVPYKPVDAKHPED